MHDDDFEKEYEKFMDWCDRKIAEKEAKRSGRVVPEIPAGASSHTVAAPTTPASLTSDTQYAEQF